MCIIFAKDFEITYRNITSLHILY